MNFERDYSEGMHEKILEKLALTNREKLDGYGEDIYSKSAKEKIKKAIGLDNLDVELLVGGTQTNQVVISSMLKNYEGVISAQTGHIAVHEAGAIETTGHKVLTVPQHDGKICAEELKEYLKTYYADDSHEHMVCPGMVYISFPTEYGTLYSKKELYDLHNVCKEYEIPLFLDGARLGYGLVSEGNDLTIKDIAELTDVFYIGGTKVGAICGEAVVFTKNNKPKHFTTTVKQKGALLAKGRLVGISFDVLFTDNLYFEIAKNAIKTASELRKAFKEKGYQFFIKSNTNQIFILLENKKMEELKKFVSFSFWEKYDDTKTVVRFATSWATDINEVKELIKLL